MTEEIDRLIADWQKQQSEYFAAPVLEIVREFAAFALPKLATRIKALEAEVTRLKGLIVP